MRQIIQIIGILMLMTSSNCSNKLDTPNYLLTYNELSDYAFETMTLDNGIHLNYRIQGNPNGRNIVLIHGGGDSQGVWDAWIDSLKTEFKIITFDLPGHGLSDPLPNNDYSISKFVEYTELFVHKLKLRDFVIGGHSFGGETALKYVLANPDKATKMILVSPGGFIQAYESAATEQIKNLTDEQVKQYYFPEFRGTKEEYKEGFKDYYFNLNSLTDESLTRLYKLSRYDKNQGAVTQFNINHLRNDMNLDHLATIDIPVLLLWGKDDKIVIVETAKKFQEGISNIELIEYENVGHMVQEENASLSVNDVLKFLD